MIYKFNNIEIDTDSYLMFSNGDELPVEPQVFNLIIYLIQNKDHVVSREQLLNHVWKGRVVSDTSINNNIKTARKVLGDDGTKQQVIKTIHSRGYQFVAELSLCDKPTRNNQSKTTKNQIAVIPFANNKPDVSSDYFGFALANQIISDLAYLNNYSIKPAGSIRKFTDIAIDPITVGIELKVDFVVTGNYLLENNIMRLNVEMIDVSKNELVWNESMQVNYSDTFSLQDMVAHQVAKGLDTGFSQNFLNHKHRDIPSSALAYEYYLRGISYPQSNEGHKLSTEMLLKSIELDPNYAPSYAHLGHHRRLLEQHGRIVLNGLKSTEWYYQKALELNPNQFDALSNLSGLYVETNRIEEALIITRKMLEIDPHNANSHFSLGYIYRYAGMLDEAIESMETALEIDPNNTRFRSIISTYCSAGKYEKALSKVYLDPGDYGIGYSALIAFNQEQYQETQRLFSQVLEIDKNGIWGLIAQLHIAVIDGDQKPGKEVLRKMVDTDVIDAENMYYFASFHALLKETDNSLDMLEKAVESGYFNYPHISKTSAFNYLQDNPRFISILQKAKKRHDEFRLRFL